MSTANINLQRPGDDRDARPRHIRAAEQNIEKGYTLIVRGEQDAYWQHRDGRTLSQDLRTVAEIEEAFPGSVKHKTHNPTITMSIQTTSTRDYHWYRSAEIERLTGIGRTFIKDTANLTTRKAGASRTHPVEIRADEELIKWLATKGVQARLVNGMLETEFQKAEKPNPTGGDGQATSAAGLIEEAPVPAQLPDFSQEAHEMRMHLYQVLAKVEDKIVRASALAGLLVERVQLADDLEDADYFLATIIRDDLAAAMDLIRPS